jgi:hypothetical protein
MNSVCGIVFWWTDIEVWHKIVLNSVDMLKLIHDIWNYRKIKRKEFQYIASVVMAHGFDELNDSKISLNTTKTN